jgi:hypothetical protein
MKCQERLGSNLLHSISGAFGLDLDGGVAVIENTMCF